MIPDEVRALALADAIGALDPDERRDLEYRLAVLPAEVRAEVARLYDAAVERLLASPHYGERWGRYWLDLARYCDVAEPWAETKGKAYLYRDWVVRALNDDMPFDEFVIKQLAADLEPNPKTADRAALGFLGLGAPPPTPEWGRTIAESREYLPDAWWYAAAPGIAIFLVVMGFNMLGDGLRDVLDPKTRRAGRPRD